MTGDRRRLALVAIPIAVLSAAGIAAAAFTFLLVREAPLLLLVLESRNRYLLLVAAKVGFTSFLVVGVLRRFAGDPFYYLLGRWYGDAAVRWIERRSGTGWLMLDVQRWFSRLAAPAVLLFPGALVCVLAGATGMSPRRFVSLNLVGSVGTVLALWFVADATAGPLAAIVDWTDRNALWLTGLLVAATAGWLSVEWRRGRGPVEGFDLHEALIEPDGDQTGPR
jgi:membrane protein DedA with SNARE-associated domain